jgi:SagB-type dehydrogenase family enzyme
VTGRGADAAWRYHDATKHSPASVRANRHVLDWDIRPIPYKLYEHLEAIALPRELPSASMPALDALASPGAGAGGGARTLDLAGLARLLRLAAGIIRKAVYPGGRETYFRAAACTGALYHVDLYLIAGPLADLPPGVYHFGPHDFALRRLRAGDHRATIAAAAADETLATAPLVVVCASTFWRNAWKYQARTYRHCYWDAGTVLANLLAAAAAVDTPTRVVVGFVDQTINDLLGLETSREVALSLVAVGCDQAARPGPAPPLTPLTVSTVALSAREVDYPAIHAVHAASSLASADEVRAWRVALPAVEPAAPGGTTVPLRPLAAPPGDPIDAVIQRRGSTRQFARVPITFEELSTVLGAATRGVPADWLQPGAHRAEIYLIVNAVEGLAAGAYVLHRGRNELEQLRTGDFRREAGFLGLGQELPADASVDVYLLADLHRILGRLGDRGYRAAQLEAAITGGKIYLAAYALGLGASGLTFFDDDVTSFFSPHARDKSVMFLVAVGRGQRQRLPVIG